ncbi:hypothetical protein [Haloarcula litorea]|uniref:hypothetical protein n=1 Tax=Haloarcula litorea TaxID=3032579 RepID=UPI0023E8882F|nr:hypothetical protein [Halomicroarcula sp. GDY20]
MNREEISPDCESCEKTLYINPVERPNVDWVKCVCSSCGEINEISMTRLSQKKRRAKGIDLPSGEPEGGSS